MKCEETAHDCRLCRVELDRVSVALGGDALLSDVSMHIHCGQLTALVGRNGAGKTTLIRALLGLVPYTGKIRHVDAAGRDLSTLTTGYVPQQLPFDREMPLSVCDLIAATLSRAPVWLGVRKKTRQTVLDILTAARAEGLIDKRLGALSGGEIQRVLLAMALSPMPDLLVLDEPVSGVDQNGLQLFLDTVSELRLRHHMAILLVSHDWALVRRYADSVALIDRRVLRVGTADEVFSSGEFSEAFPRGGDGETGAGVPARGGDGDEG